MYIVFFMYEETDFYIYNSLFTHVTSVVVQKNPQVSSIILASGATVNVRKLLVAVAVLTNPQTTVICHHLIYREVYPFIPVQYIYFIHNICILLNKSVKMEWNVLCPHCYIIIPTSDTPPP